MSPDHPEQPIDLPRLIREARYRRWYAVLVKASIPETEAEAIIESIRLDEMEERRAAA